MQLLPLQELISGFLLFVKPYISNAPTVFFPFAGLLFGILAGLSPCSLSIAPLWLGVLLAEKEQHPEAQPTFRSITRKTTAFVLGLGTVYAILGVLVFQLKLVIFGAWQTSWLFLGLGVITLVLGLQVLGVLQVLLPSKVLEGVNWLQKTAKKTGRWKSYLLGVAYSFLLSPCGTPLLTATGTLAVQSKSIVLTALILACYGIGQGMVLYLLALGLDWLKNKTSLRKMGEWLNKAGGIILIGLGLYLLWQGFSLYK
jgi:cytochrome c biogenesis protein CcdA